MLLCHINMPVASSLAKYHAGGLAFVAGATAAVGSSVVKVPLAVCIRSVQAGLHPNPIAAAQSLVRAAGVRSLFTVCATPPITTSIVLSLFMVLCSTIHLIEKWCKLCTDSLLHQTQRTKNDSCGVQGFVPTLLEDVPDMAVKFAVYESLRPLHSRVFGGRQVRVSCRTACFRLLAHMSEVGACRTGLSVVHMLLPAG